MYIEQKSTNIQCDINSGTQNQIYNAIYTVGPETKYTMRYIQWDPKPNIQCDIYSGTRNQIYNAIYTVGPSGTRNQIYNAKYTVGKGGRGI